jgi:hypothetical protein
LEARRCLASRLQTIQPRYGGVKRVHRVATPAVADEIGEQSLMLRTMHLIENEVGTERAEPRLERKRPTRDHEPTYPERECEAA